MATRTINLTGAEVAVLGLDGANAHIRNDSAAAIYAAKSAGINAGADGVLSIPAGQSARLDSISGTVYLLGTVSVQLVSNDYTESPFKAVSTSGGADVIPNAAELVTLDGLQGGVPFSDIMVSGKNLIPYPYSDNSVTRDGVSFVTNADGTISISGTATQDAYFNFAFNKDILLKKGIAYTLSTEILEGSAEHYGVALQYTNASGAEQFAGAGNTVGNSVTFIPENDIKCRMWLRVNSGKSANCTITAMLEEGDNSTEYERPIVGREITLTACGKNLIPYPYRSKDGTVNGVTFIVSNDGSISVSGTATANTNFYICFDRQLNFPNGKYTMSGCPAGGSLNTYRMEAYSYDDDNKIIFSEKDIGSGAVVDLSSGLHFGIRIGIFQGVTCENLIFRPQLECGNTATEYKPCSGSTTTITPDSNPYTVPNDIRQQDGINNVSVSAGEVSVTGVKRNAAVKRIWDKLDELTTAIIVSNGEI